MMVDHLHDFRRLPDHDLDAAPPRLLADVGGDRQLPVGSRPDPEVSRIPGDLLGSGQRRVTELILAFLRRTFLPLADPSACDDQVMLIPDASMVIAPNLNLSTCMACSNQEPPRLEVSSILSHGRLGRRGAPPDIRGRNPTRKAVEALARHGPVGW